MGKDRLMWALVVDEILASDMLGKTKALANCPSLRVNQFLQMWHSRVNRRRGLILDEEEPKEIPANLREMIKVARKHRVRLEAIHPSLEVRRELPAICSAQTREEAKLDTLNNKLGKCIRDKHRTHTLVSLCMIFGLLFLYVSTSFGLFYLHKTPHSLFLSQFTLHKSDTKHQH